MTLEQTIQEAIKEAMKAKDTVVMNAVRATSSPYDSEKSSRKRRRLRQERSFKTFPKVKA